MAMNLGRYGSRELLKLQIFDYVTATPLMNFDYANTGEQAWTSDRQYATGGSGGVRRIAWDGEKQSTITISTQIFTMDHLAMLSGNSIVSGTQNIYKSEILTVESSGSDLQVTLSRTPVGGAVTVFPFVNGVKTATPETIQGVSSKVVTLDSGTSLVAGDEVEVYYQWQASNANKLSFTAKGFPKYVKLVGDSLYADEVAGEFVPLQNVYYKAKLQPNYTVAYNATGTPAELQLVFDLFAVPVNGVDTMAEMIIYEDSE